MPAARPDDAVATSTLTLVPRVALPPSLSDLLRRAGTGDTEAAAAVYDATIDDAWRIALVTAGSPERATAVVRDAYERIWSEAGADGAAWSADPAPLSRSWALAVVYRVGRESTALAPSA